MNYGLARRVIGSSAFVDLSEEEYSRIKSAKENLLKVMFIEQNFDVVIENYLELEMGVLEIATRYTVLQELNDIYFRSQNERNLVNRRIINLLSACRSYLDQNKHHLHNIFGKESMPVIEVEGFKNKQYNYYLGYRVMEALRNYVQHRGLPIYGFRLERKLMKTKSGNRFLFSLTPYIQPELLEEDKEFKKTVLEELKSLGDKIDIKPLIRDYVASLGSVHEKIRDLLKGDIHCWTETILTAMQRFKERYPQEESIIGLAAVIRNDDGTYSQPVPLFEDLIEYRQQLAMKYSNLSNLGKRYVSSEVVEPIS